MDIQEATNRVLANLKRLDHENATKIMGHILIQDQGDKEIIRLAFFSDTALTTYINQAKARLGLQQTSNNNNHNNHAAASSSSSPSTTPHSNNNNNPFPQTTTTSSPRIMVPNNGFHLTAKPSSPFSRTTRPISSSYAAAVLNGSSSSGGGGQVSSNFSGPGSPGLGFSGGGNEFLLGGENGTGHVSFFKNSGVDRQIVMSPSGRSDSLIFPYNNNINVNAAAGGGGDDSILPPPHSFHRRTCSANAFLTGGFEEEKFNNVFGSCDYYKPCIYFTRGNCRDGSDCKFPHCDFSDFEVMMGSPSRNGSGFDEFLRAKAFPQKLAYMGSGRRHPFSSSYNNKCMSFLEGNRRNDFSHMGFGGASSSSANQIYLTFPADSTFKEEDVTNYFSMFGPVRDVRIPYQQKRMFGFVTFVYPETVKLILAKGNPHFVCDSRVLVKPYKEKGKILDKKHHRQHLDKCDYLASLSSSEFDTLELNDLPVGPRMLHSQEMMRRRFEQEAIESQSQKMMNLQLKDIKNLQKHDFHFPRRLPNCMPVSSPRMMNRNVIASSSDASNHEGLQGFDVGEDASKSLAIQADDLKSGSEKTESSSNNFVDGGRSCLRESFKHVLPDNLFASPSKSTTECEQSFSYVSSDNNNDDSAINASSDETVSISGNSPIDIASPRYFQVASH